LSTQAWFLDKFPAFESRNFRLFFWSQVISFLGNWLQIAGQSWLIGDITHSALAIGVNGALLAVPVVLVAPFGGMIVGRFQTRTTLYLAQILGLIQAIALGILVATHHATPQVIDVFALISGFILGIEAPARNTFLVESVPEKAIGSVVALNFGIVYLGITLGFGAAGAIIATIGAGTAFFVNATTYVGAIIAIALMTSRELEERHSIQPFRAFARNVKDAMREPQLRLLLGLVFGTLAISFPARTMLPAVINIFRTGPLGFGFLAMAYGAGGLLGMSVVSSHSEELATVCRPFVTGGCAVAGVALICFSQTTNLYLGILEMAVAGTATVTFISTIQAMLRTVANNKMLSHVLGLDVMMFWSGTAVSNFLIGWAGSKLGVETAIATSGFALIATGMLLAKRKTI
jgi:MFS family permease